MNSAALCLSGIETMTLKDLSIVAAALMAANSPSFAGSLTAWGTAQTPPALGTDVIAISSAADHSLALKADGTVVAWGHNCNYQCNVPGGLSAVRSVAAGDFFSVAALSNGTVVAWGDNMYGQCDLPPLNNVVAVSAGRAHAVALRSDGSVISWGNGIFGQTNQPSGLGTIKAVQAAANYTMALRTDGTVVVWGSNDSGQTEVPAGLSGVVAIDGSVGYCMALKQDGTIVMWGQAPTPPDWVGKSVAIAAGEDHALSLRDDGLVIAWGLNNAGQLDAPSTDSFSALTASWHFSAGLSGAAPVVLRAHTPVLTPTALEISVESQVGQSYWLEYKNSLSDPSWTRLPTVAGTGGTLNLMDSNPSSVGRFYRVGSH